MSKIGIRDLFDDRIFATFMLIFMSVQFIFIEGMTISIPKVAFMSLMPLVLLVKFPQISKALILGFIYLIVTMLMCEMNGGISRMSTFIYTALFLFMFSVYYGLVWLRNCFDIAYFINLLKWIIWAYTICLILQQIYILVGIKYMPFINLLDAPYYSVTHLNSLAIEPSHGARLMTVFFYGFLKCTEYSNGGPLSIKELFKQHRWVIIAFIYFMLFLGSGTAFVGLAILSLYFLKKKYIFSIVLATLVFYLMSPYIDYEPYNRAVATLNAAMTGDTEEVIRADHSASFRVNILIDTFTKTDILDSQTWFGHGMDDGGEYAITGAIYRYGMISYILKLIFFILCCFTSVFSLETLIFIILFGMNVGNISYGWAALMVFTTLKYFRQQYYG